MNDAKKICVVVTLHGVGFEQPPLLIDGVFQEGYADSLHQHLREQLDNHANWRLGDDPNVQRAGNGRGAIYVESCWADEGSKPSYEAGLKRLGIWSPTMERVEYDKDVCGDDSSCLMSKKDYDSGCRVSHVALVYSKLETTKDEFGAASSTLVRSVFGGHRYITFFNFWRKLIMVFGALVGKSNKPDPMNAALRPRRDMSSRHKRKEKMVPTPPSSEQLGPLKGFVQGGKALVDTVRYLIRDVACYIYENDERHRVQSFVREALTRLAHRDDVGSIVLNTHSNGTVIALDVLCQLSPEVITKIRAFVTAGSPLRKYITLFSWGTRVECHYSFFPWYNFWDECDPVADKLNRLADGPQGGKVNHEENLFSWIAPNRNCPVPLNVRDIKVDNVHNSRGGGLQAHNYWDNEDEFVPRLASIISGEEPGCGRQLSSGTLQMVP